MNSLRGWRLLKLLCVNGICILFFLAEVKGQGSLSLKNQHSVLTQLRHFQTLVTAPNEYHLVTRSIHFPTNETRAAEFARDLRAKIQARETRGVSIPYEEWWVKSVEIATLVSLDNKEEFAEGILNRTTEEDIRFSTTSALVTQTRPGPSELDTDRLRLRGLDLIFEPRRNRVVAFNELNIAVNDPAKIFLPYAGLSVTSGDWRKYKVEELSPKGRTRTLILRPPVESDSFFVVTTDSQYSFIPTSCSLHLAGVDIVAFFDYRRIEGGGLWPTTVTRFEIPSNGVFVRAEKYELSNVKSWDAKNHKLSVSSTATVLDQRARVSKNYNDLSLIPPELSAELKRGFRLSLSSAGRVGSNAKGHSSSLSESFSLSKVLIGIILIIGGIWIIFRLATTQKRMSPEEEL